MFREDGQVDDEHDRRPGENGVFQPREGRKSDLQRPAHEDGHTGDEEEPDKDEEAGALRAHIAVEDDAAQKEDGPDGRGRLGVVLDDQVRHVKTKHGPAKTKQRPDDDHGQGLNHLAHPLAGMGKDGGHGHQIRVEAIDGDDLGDDGNDERYGAGDGVLEDALPELVGLPVAPDDSHEPLKERLGRHGGGEGG